MKLDDKRLVCSDEKILKIKESIKATRSKREHQICRVIELKVVKKRLSKKQIEDISKMFLEAKWFYNYLLSKSEKENIPLSKINTTSIKEIIKLDRDKNEIVVPLEQLSAQCKQKILARMLANLKTMKILFKSGKQKTKENLKFKSEVNCIPLKQFGNSYSFKGERKVKISGISGKLLIRGWKQIDFENMEFADAKLIRKPDGLYLQVTTYIDEEKILKVESNGQEIGIDFGCQDNLTFSDGRKVNVQVEESERLKKLQMQLNRRQTKRSNNRNKTIQKIRREYQKIVNKKKDKANKVCSELKKYELVVIQDEQLANWKKIGHGKKIQHSCLGTIKTKLKSYSNVIVLERFIPTTKFCSNCGKKLDLKLWDRTFKCSCGVKMDRDVHAAKNMLEIFHLVDEYMVHNNFVPADYREVKLVDFKKAISGTKRFQKEHLKDEARRCNVFSVA